MPETFTNADLADCAKREVGMRRRAFPRWIKNKRMTQAKADREIAQMLQIQAHFERLAEADRQRETPTLL